VWSNSKVGPDLAKGRGRKPLGARHLQDGLFIEIIAAEMLVDIGQDRIVLDKGDDGIAGGPGRITGKDRVAERSGIAEIVAGRHARSVGHGERRKQRMRVLEIDALVADLGHCRRGFGRDLQCAQSVGNEQDHIVGRAVLGQRGADGQPRQASGQQQD
jgi:hypothetical protein